MRSDFMSVKSVRFSVFRAVDDEDICKKYIEGHIHVLKVYGITQITSARIDWILNPSVYVLVAEDMESGEVLAGARLQVADGRFRLPIEEAIGGKDAGVYPYIERMRLNGGTAELCGLWNSRKIAGYGIGSIFLGRTAIAIAGQLGIKTVVGLCAPATKENCFRTGFIQEASLGDGGEFIYPKEDLIATALIIPDLAELSHASPEDRKRIISLRRKKSQTVIELTRRGEVLVEYHTRIPKITNVDQLILQN